MVDIDTVRVTVYTLVDTFYQAHIAPHKSVRRGHQPEMHDSEVLTLMLLGQWRGNSERALLRYTAAHLPAYFPVILSQSAFNRRSRALGPACAQLRVVVADALEATRAPYQAVDTTPVPGRAPAAVHRV